MALPILLQLLITVVMPKLIAAHLFSLLTAALLVGAHAPANAATSRKPIVGERIVEWTVSSRKAYEDPFNDVDVDVIFTKDGRSWRVPTFWRGDQEWTVRFAPPTPGIYRYHLISTDRANKDLNGHEGQVTITAYAGESELLRRGPLRVSANKRYFEHADGTPFYWLGDTWWLGLSDRLSWEGFQKLTIDRKAKGFTLIQMAAGLVPIEQPPEDPGFCNEGGCVWGSDFQRINPKYFDYADRRIQWLLANDLMPLIVGGWGPILPRMGVKKMQQHWRYIIARYGAYPVLWAVGGEVIDPPPHIAQRMDAPLQVWRSQGWTEVARYVRSNDPYRHPLSTHEVPPVFLPLQDDSITDYVLLQAGQGSPSLIPFSVAQVNLHYSRTAVKPVVQDEVGFEAHLNRHYEDFQRNAFWLSMLNGAAGHSYGADATWGSYTSDKRLHRFALSFRTWEEGMNLPGSYQVGLGGKLLRQYRWWNFRPHPEWVTPRGTTMLEPWDNGQLKPTAWPEIKSDDESYLLRVNNSRQDSTFPYASFHKPYAAGIPGEVRVVYIPDDGFSTSPPTVLGLEPDVQYSAYFWEPSLGIRVDLGTVRRPAPGAKRMEDSFAESTLVKWTEPSGNKAVQSSAGKLSLTGSQVVILKDVSEADAVVAVEAQSNAVAGMVLRYADAGNYVAVVYDPQGAALYLLDRKQGADGELLGRTPVPVVNGAIRLTAEVRGDKGIASLSDGLRTYTTPIVQIENAKGGVGLLHRGEAVQAFDNFELRGSPALVQDEPLPRKIYDATGDHRGDLVGPPLEGAFRISSWDDFGRDKHILLDAYRPERLPTPGEWLLVLETREAKQENARLH